MGVTGEERARYAKRLAGDPAFEAVLETLEADAVNQFKSSAPADLETRERAYYQQMAIEQVRQQIQLWAAEAG